MHTKFSSRNLKGRCLLADIDIDEKKILEKILNLYRVKGRELKWIRMETSDRLR
jgi:hypothetical protein